MEAKTYCWNEIVAEHPIPLITRRKVEGERILVAKVRLEKGCFVARHRHDSEQVGILVSGHTRWTIGDQAPVDLLPGNVIVVPSNVDHAVEALEDSEVIDILSPPGPMGIDSQGS